jgi:hypothetical protein
MPVERVGGSTAWGRRLLVRLTLILSVQRPMGRIRDEPCNPAYRCRNLVGATRFVVYRGFRWMRASNKRDRSSLIRILTLKYRPEKRRNSLRYRGEALALSRNGSRVPAVASGSSPRSIYGRYRRRFARNPVRVGLGRCSSSRCSLAPAHLIFISGTSCENRRNSKSDVPWTARSNATPGQFSSETSTAFTA